MRARPLSLLLSFVLLLGLASAAQAELSFVPDRRRSQFQKEPAYVAVPYVYDFPGIGSGFGILGAAANIYGTNTDVVGTVFFGDVMGEALGIDAIHLIPEKLILDIGTAHMSTVSIQNYSQRGMATSRHDYTLIEFGDTFFDGARLTATFLERRLEAYAGFYGGSTQIKSIRDKDGNVIIEAKGGEKDRSRVAIYGGRVDLTDDYMDPRRGFRADMSWWRTPPSETGPDFYSIDYNATAFLPLGRRSTWAFNYYRSDAHVLRQGETDRAVIEQRTGLDCASLADPEQQRLCYQVIDTTIAGNTYGSASSLGGMSRLRSYPNGRYTGAHAEFYGTEIRWNLTDETTPFNIIVMKDIRTAFQIALFYETGTVADRRDELWDIRRSSYGTGFRMVTASGLVYRIDLATGYEGIQTSIFFQYPWEM